MFEVVAVVWDGPYHSVCIYVRWSVCGYNSVVLWFLNMVDLYQGKKTFWAHIQYRVYMVTKCTFYGCFSVTIQYEETNNLNSTFKTILLRMFEIFFKKTIERDLFDSYTFLHIESYMAP